MGITAGFHLLRMAWPRWSGFRGFPCRPILCRTSLWVAPLGIRSAASLCSSSSRGLAHVRRLGLLLAMVALGPAVLPAQLTTGAIEGIVRGMDGRPVAGAPILVTGGAGFRTVIHSNSNGEFFIVLPYGRYRLSGSIQTGAVSSSATVLVAPLQTARFDLIMDTSGAIRSVQPAVETIGIWTDATSGRVYSDALSLPGLLLSRDPSSVTEPLDFTGLSDNRLAVESQLGFSWTDVQYKLHGMDATDSHQPGLPAVLPDVQALYEVVVRSAFTLTASSSPGTEVGLFLAEPGASWHGGVSTPHSGAAFSSTNLPPPAFRSAVQQADQFRWFTRDRLEIGGPVTKWADIYAFGSGRWA